LRRKTVRLLFLTWALLSTGWLANAYRMRGVGPALLHELPAHLSCGMAIRP